MTHTETDWDKMVREGREEAIKMRDKCYEELDKQDMAVVLDKQNEVIKRGTKEILELKKYISELEALIAERKIK